eukprot:9504143-Pyramimonas_sp.AAC.1
MSNAVQQPPHMVDMDIAKARLDAAKHVLEDPLRAIFHIAKHGARRWFGVARTSPAQMPCNCTIRSLARVVAMQDQRTRVQQLRQPPGSTLICCGDVIDGLHGPLRVVFCGAEALGQEQAGLGSIDRPCSESLAIWSVRWAPH